MKKIILSLCVLIFSVSLVSALDIVTEELEKDYEEITFINYVGPHEYVSTWQEVISIGAFLGNNINESGSNYWNKYRIISVGDLPDIENRFSADIFVIESGALVDHIVNVQGVIAGYLSNKYGYTFDEAILLAKFVSYYNAAFRGNLPYFQENYTDYVMNNLSQENAGIDINYQNWAGNTRMLIPLRTSILNPEETSLDTMELANDTVIEQLSSQEGEGIEDRQDMVELREEENLTVQEQIEEEAARIEETEDRIEEERLQLEEGTHSSQQSEDTLVEDETIPLEQTSSSESPSTLAETELAQDSATTTPIVDETPQEAIERLDEEEAQLEEDKVVLAEAIADVEERDDDVMEERIDVAEALQEELDQTAAEVVLEPIPVVFLKVIDFDNGIPLSAFVTIDERTGLQMEESEVNTIRGRDYILDDSDLIVIAGREDGNKAVRLVKLDPESLEILSEGQDNIYSSSILMEEDGFIYAITGSENDWHLGQFNKQLEVQHQSTNRIEPNSLIVFSNKGIYVQETNGEIVILRKDDLILLEQ